MGDADFLANAGVTFCITVPIAASICAGIFAKELNWYNTQLQATCRDDLSSGSALAEIKTDTRRRRGGSSREYSCTFLVDAVEDATQTAHTDLYRYANSVYWGETSKADSDMTYVRNLCNSNYTFLSPYSCFVQDGSSDIRFERTGYPTGLLAATCLLWSISFLSSLVCYLCGIWSSLPNRTVCTSGDYSYATLPQQIGHIKAAGEATLPQQIGNAKDRGEASAVELQGQFRRVIAEDLCDELIPGLKLRVQWPSMGPLKRWFAATAVGYNVCLRTITFKYDYMSIPFRKITLALSDGRVRFHESALSQVAKRRIIKNAIEISLFGGSTFDQLDANGNGS
jgi:hypothetical protein